MIVAFKSSVIPRESFLFIGGIILYPNRKMRIWGITGKNREVRKMTEAQINEIQSLFYSGMTKAEIARKMDCPIGRIDYYTGKRYYSVKKPMHKKTEGAREKIIYKGVYDFLQEHKELSLYAFCEVVLNKAELYDHNKSRPLQDFLQGKHKGHFSLDVFQAICNVVGKSFEETFERRNNEK